MNKNYGLIFLGMGLMIGALAPVLKWTVILFGLGIGLLLNGLISLIKAKKQ